MENAFNILGATPSDNRNRLSDILEEKQLFADDDSELQWAYSELTNQKKRTAHEVLFFIDDSFNTLNDYITASKKPSKVADVSQAIVDLGHWFEYGTDELFETINENRNISGFVQVEELNVLSEIIETIKADTISAINTYLDKLTTKTIANIFNALVEIDDYESFFVDELMARYEQIISNDLSEQEKICTDTFNEIERLAKSFNNGNSLSEQLDESADTFIKQLKEWDKYAQPLQVNMEKRGGEHENSSKFVHDIRNRIVDLCNKSQDSLQKLISAISSPNYSNFSAYVTAKEKLPEKLKESVIFIDIIIKLTDALYKTFKELEIVAEQLKADKKSLNDLKNTLTTLSNQVQTAKSQTYRNAYSFGSYNNSDRDTSKWATEIRWIVGILAVFAPIFCISAFSASRIGFGLLYLVVSIGIYTSAICWKKEKIKLALMRIIAVCLAGLMLLGIILLSAIPYSPPPVEGQLTSSNFDDCFDTNFYHTQSSLIYDITPKHAEYAKSARSSSTITLTVKYSFTGGSGHTQSVSVTLKKSNGYEAHGSVAISSYYFTYSSFSTKITSISGYVYVT